ncbi:MAG: hypothetical protein NO475_03635 [Candidatus Methanomethylicia archaeon]|nr:hypothetical protein [Candidatus Methanomethylicia archaeon]
MSLPKAPILKLTITPVDIEIEDSIVTVLEVTKLNLPWEEYIASIQIKYKNAVSRIFNITFKNSDDLKQKLITEVMKFKYTFFLFSSDELKRRGIII